MRHYVQLKDGVVVAHIETANEIPTSDTIIEVDENGESFLTKEHKDGNFVDAEKLRYAIVDTADNNVVLEIKETYFSSEMDKDNGKYVDPSIKVTTGWFWNGEEGSASSFLSPEQFSIENQQPIIVENSPGE